MHASHHCFKKIGYANKESSTELRSYHRYTLVGIARQDVSGLDIYSYFFNSPFTRHQSSTRQKPVSTFFQAFCQLYIMKSLFYRTQSLSLGKEIEKIINEDLFKHKKREILNQQDRKISDMMIEDRKILKRQAKRIGEYIQAKYKNVLDKSKQSEEDIRASFLEYASVLNHEITYFIEDYMTNLRVKMQEVMLKEQVPEGVAEDVVAMYIRTNLQSINRIEIMRSAQRLILITRLNCLNPVIGLKFDKNEKHDIIIRNFTNEREPILISLADYAMHRKNLFHGKHRSETWRVLVQNIILAFCQFRTQSGRCLPKITARDVYFDQHSLKIGLLYNKIILDAIGFLNPATRSMEAKLIFGLTPTTNEQECYLEDIPEYQWKLRQRYYLKLEEQNDGSLLDLQQKIHVWRIIDLIFFLSTRQHLTQHYYRKQYPNIQFDIATFKKTRKKVYDYISEFKKQIWNIIPDLNSTREEYEKEYKSFNFSLWELRSIVGQQEQDSFLKALHPIRIYQQLNLRKDLLWSVHQMLTQEQFFTRIRNPKKYAIILLLDYIEQVNYLRIVRLHPQGVKEEQQLKEEYKLRDQFQKRSKRITDVYEKLAKYYSQAENHPQRKYMEDPNRKEFFSKIFALYKKWLDLAKNDNRLREEQQKVKELQEPTNYAQHKEAVEKSRQLFPVLKKMIELNGGSLMAEAKQLIVFFMHKEMNEDLLLQPENANKKPPPNDDHLWVDFSRYICKKLAISVAVMLCLNSDNWKRYECLCRSVLANGKSVGTILEEIREKQKLGLGQMQQRSGKLDVIQQWLGEQVCKDAQLKILRQSFRGRVQ